LASDGAPENLVVTSGALMFIITSDRDFKEALADPAGMSVQFILVSRPTGLGTLDAINQSYRGMYESGAGIASLARQFSNVGDGSDWRLYRVAPAR